MTGTPKKRTCAGDVRQVGRRGWCPTAPPAAARGLQGWAVIGARAQLGGRGLLTCGVCSVRAARQRAGVPALHTTENVSAQVWKCRAAAPMDVRQARTRMAEGRAGSGAPAARGQPRVCGPRPAGTGLAGSWGGAWASAATRRITWPAGRKTTRWRPRAGFSVLFWGCGSRTGDVTRQGWRAGAVLRCPFVQPRSQRPRVCQADPTPSQPAIAGPEPRGSPRVRAQSHVVFRPYICCVLPTRMAGTPSSGRFLAEGEKRCCRYYWANPSWIQMHSPFSSSVDYRFLPLFKGSELPPCRWRKKTLSVVGLKVAYTSCPSVGIYLTCLQELLWNQEGVTV